MEGGNRAVERVRAFFHHPYTRTTFIALAAIVKFVVGIAWAAIAATAGAFFALGSDRD